jgi:hypothetical protein
MRIELGTPALTEPVNITSAGKHFPSLYIEGGRELFALPEDGVMTIEVHRVSRTETSRNGETQVRVEFEVRAIEEASGTDSESVQLSTTDVLKNIAKEVLGQ